MTKFANETTVPVDKTRMEIERLINKYGASKFASGWDQGGAVVLFEMQKRRLKFVLPLPQKNDPKFKSSPHYRYSRTPAQAKAAWEQEIRSRWRALLLLIKAKLEAVESGISVFDEEFLAHIVLPNGQTMAEHFVPQIDQIYQTQKMPPLLLGFQEDSE